MAMRAQKMKISDVEVTIDKSLERYRGKVLFSEKLRKINEILAKEVPPQNFK
jgi:hypothetical protein